MFASTVNAAGGSTTAAGTGQTFDVSATSVNTKMDVVARLES